MTDKLEEEYFKLVKRFKGPAFERYGTPEELKKLANLLMYRRMKKELKDEDVDTLIKDSIGDLKEILNNLVKL